jgi:YVTN family beta-propeller protein
MQEFGQYQIEGLIGSGGMGEVYRAYDTRRDRQVALKLLPMALSDDPEYQRRFQRESYAVARLREPHVIPIHDYGEIDGRLFIDMRLVDGPNLGAVIAESGSMTPARAVNLISQVAEALDAAHSDGVVHRDIKPSNVLVTPSDFVYVVDFGIAHAIGHTRSRLTMTGATLGTLDYMAPERFESHPVDPRTDVYSLACVLFECLTAQKPFTGDDLPALMYAHLYASPRKVSEVNPAAGSALDAVIAKGMAKKPADRYPSTGALAAAARVALVATGDQTEHIEEVTRRTEHTEEVTRRVDAGSEADTIVGRPLVAAPVAVGAGVGAGLMEYGGGRGPEPRHDDPGATTTVGVPLDYDDFPPAGPPPGGPAGPPPYGPPDAAPAGRPSSRRRLVVLLAVIVLLVAAAAGGAVWLLSRGSTSTPEAGTPSASPGVPTGNGPAIVASPVAPLARSIDTPTVGPTVQANATPGYMQIAPNGKYAYVANREAGVLSVFDTTRNTVTGTIKVPQGGPQFIAFAPDGKTAYVSLFNNDRTVNLVGVLDTATSTFTKMVSVGVRPFALDVTPDGKRVYVPNHDSGSITVIDTATDDVVDTIKVAPNPHWVDISTDGKTLYAANHESNVVSVIDTATDKVLTTIPVGLSPHSILKHPTKPLLFNVNYDSSSLTVIDTNTNKVIQTIPTGSHPQDISLSSDGQHLYIAAVDDNAIQVFSVKTMSIVSRIPVGRSPTSVAVGRDGRQAYVTNLADGTVTILNLAGTA